MLGAERDHDGRALPALGSSNHHIDFTAATAGTDEPVAPIEHGRLGAISSGHFAGVGLDLMLAFGRSFFRLGKNPEPEILKGAETLGFYDRRRGFF